MNPVNYRKNKVFFFKFEIKQIFVDEKKNCQKYFRQIFKLQKSFEEKSFVALLTWRTLALKRLAKTQSHSDFFFLFSIFSITTSNNIVQLQLYYNKQQHFQTIRSCIKFLLSQKCWTTNSFANFICKLSGTRSLKNRDEKKTDLEDTKKYINKWTQEIISEHPENEEELFNF